MGRYAKYTATSIVFEQTCFSTNCKSGPKELKKFGYDIKLSPVNDINSYAIQMEKLSKSKINISKNLLLNKDIQYLLEKN